MNPNSKVTWEFKSFLQCFSCYISIQLHALSPAPAVTADFLQILLMATRWLCSSWSATGRIHRHRHCGSVKKTSVFPLQKTPTLTVSFFENRDLEWYNRSGEMSLFEKLILGVCLLHPVFLSDVLSDVVDVPHKYSADSALFIHLLICTRQQ